MCGIVGYVGDRDAAEVLIKGLKRLEYRGYDSAGIAIMNGELNIQKGKGKVANLNKRVQENSVKGHIGIGHTRWATHGEPNDVNSHPHLSESGKIAVVHNGIIENYGSLKRSLTEKGRTFKSMTDTEIIAQLIEEIYTTSKDLTFEEAIRLTLKQIVGTYGLAIVNLENPEKIYIARKGSPLLLGVGDNEMFIASDASPIVEYTNKVVYLDDGEMAVVDRNGYDVKTIDDVSLTKEVHELAISLEEIEKAGYPHFMLKEIFEQPKSLADCMRGRIDPDKGTIQLGGIADVLDELADANRIVIAACGTSWHSGLVGEYLFEYLAKTPVEVEYASEFRYKEPLVGPDDVMIVISQSGETADTLAALREAKERGATVIGVVNVVGSTIARETDAGVYIHAGPEIGVASTKAFTGQVTVLTLLTILLGRRNHLNAEFGMELLEELQKVPDKIRQVLDQSDTIREIAEVYKDHANCLYLGRGVNFPIALEGALKLKEISYIHAEGYPAAEMKHGPIALIDPDMPVVVIATRDSSYEKIVSNVQEVKARNGIVIAIVTEGDDTIINMADHVIEIPDTDSSLVSLLSTIPLQLIAYHIAVMRGCNVDQPRNLAKSVTVE